MSKGQDDTNGKPSRALAIPVPGPGRNSKYRPEFNDQARKLCLLGATDQEIADFFTVDPSTIYEWQKRHPAFSQSMIDGKVKADAEVADSLFQRATGGHVCVEQLVKKDDGSFEAMRITKYVPGDPQAAYRWLLNRRRQDWSDTKVVEHTGEIEMKHRVQSDADAFTSGIARLAERAGAGSGASETQH